MRVELVGRFKVRACDEDGDLSDVGRKRRVRDHRFGQLPNRLSKFGLVDPWIPRAQQRTVVANVDEALEVLGDAIPHVVIERLLFGIQFGRGNDGQAHLSNSGYGCLGLFAGGIAKASELKVTLRSAIRRSAL